MTKPSALNRLYFGREDAERDIADGLLRAGFLRTVAFDAAVSGRKMLIIGRKGSGKSAICMHLTAPGVHPGGTVLITPDDAAGDEIRRFELQGLTGDTAKSLIWRYVFAVQAARHIVGHAKHVHGRRSPGSVRALRRFLRANGEQADARLYDRLVAGVTGLQTSLSLEAFGIKASLDAGVTSEGARAARQLDVVEQGVARAFHELGCAVRHPPLLLLVDQLEQVWSSDPDSHAMVIGLLLAAKHVTGAYGGAVRCLLFLRSDIYDMLNFSEGDKFHSDELRIHWNHAGLRELALARARASVGTELTHEQLWQKVFPPQVGGENTVDFLFSRALPRPRDAIQYLNLCRDTAVERGHDSIQEIDVIVATRQFSEWKLQDLAKEYLVTHPFLSRLFVIFQNTGYVVMRSALRSRFDDVAHVLRRQFPEYSQALTPAGVIDTLYGVGFLGVRRGNDVVYTGGAHPPVQPHESEFHIHPCFRSALNAVSPIELHKYEPQSIRHLLTTHTRTVPSSDAGYGVGDDFALLDQLTRSCEGILRQLGRAAALPEDARGQLSHQIGRVMSESTGVLKRLRQGEVIDAHEHVVEAAHYLNTLANKLHASGMADGAAVVVRRIEDEARKLIHAAGGRRGSSGSSYS